MNRIFRLVFNRRLAVVQVASEVASHRGGAARGAAPRRRAHPLAAAMSLVLAVPMLGTMSPALAQALINEGRTIDEDTTFATGVDIGSDSAGSVLVKDGAVVASGQLRLGVLADSHGSLVVQGPGSQWLVHGSRVLDIGLAGVGELSVVDGGTLDAAAGGYTRLAGVAGSTGSLTVRGDGSTMRVTQLAAGHQGNGSLAVLEGGRLTTTAGWSGFYEYGLGLGSGEGGAGHALVAGSGSLLEVKGNHLDVGVEGKGTLTVAEAGEVRVERELRVRGRAGTDPDGPTGLVNILEGGQISAGRVIISDTERADGRIIVDGAGSLLSSDDIIVGSQAKGELVVRNGGAVAGARLAAEDSKAISRDYDQAGHVHVTGTGSRLEVGQLVLSDHTLIEEQAQVLSAEVRLQESYAADGSRATLRGAGTLWRNSDVFETRTNLDVLDGARIETATAHISGGGDSAEMRPVIKVEQVRVQGNGARLQATQELKVGRGVFDGFGVLALGEGGSIGADGEGVLLTRGGYLSLGGGWAAWDQEAAAMVFAEAVAAGSVDVDTRLRLESNGTLLFNHTHDEYVLANALESSENGGVIRSLAGSTTLDGDLSSYRGKVEVAGGRLVINSDIGTVRRADASGSQPDQQLRVTGGTLVVNGTAGFEQDIVHSGTPVRERTSSAAASLAGVLAGSGTLGELVILQGGTVAPGDGGIGTLRVEGDAYFNNGTLLAPDQKAFYDVDVRGNGQSDLLQITGKARIGAHDGFTGGPTGVRVTALDPQVSYQNGQAYTILTAQAGVSGRFDDVTTRSAFLTPSLSYTDTSVVLTLAVAGSGGPTPTPTPPDPGNNPGTPAPTPSPNPTAPSPAPPLVFDRVARTANQYATAMALNSLVQSGDALALYNGLLELSEDEALVAFDQLSGQLHASTRGVLLEDRLLRDGIRQRMHNADPDSRDLGVSAWLSGGGASARNDAGSEAHRLHSSRNGLVVGVDGRLGDAFVLGLALGQQEQRVQQRSLSAAADIDSVHGGLYAGFERNAWSLLLGGGHTTYSVGSRRQLGVGVAPQSLHSDYDARGTTLFAEAGWKLALGGAQFVPYVGAAHGRVETDAFVERGGNAALQVEAGRDTYWTTTLGLRVGWDISTGQDEAATLSAGLAWQNAQGDLRPFSAQRFVAGSNGFDVGGIPLERNLGIAELGVAVNTSANSRLSMAMQGRAGGEVRELGAHLDWRWQF